MCIVELRPRVPIITSSAACVGLTCPRTMSLASRGGEKESRDATPIEDDRDDDQRDADAEE